MNPLRVVLAATMILGQSAWAQSHVEKPAVAGVTNFAQVQTTVACAGATTTGALAGIKKMGYASVINLRLASEKGANIEAEAAEAKNVGIHFVHLPFNGSAPDPAVVDQFLKVITQPENQPAFIHCASGNRASALWMIKRVLVDKWDKDRAAQEATELGLTHEALKTFAFNYIDAHQK